MSSSGTVRWVYAGPLRDEPLAVELHNTLYASGGELVDGLIKPRAWLDALRDRLPAVKGAGPSRAELVALRDAVRSALAARTEGRVPNRAALDALNAAAARAPAT